MAFVAFRLNWSTTSRKEFQSRPCRRRLSLIDTVYYSKYRAGHVAEKVKGTSP